MLGIKFSNPFSAKAPSVTPANGAANGVKSATYKSWSLARQVRAAKALFSNNAPSRGARKKLSISNPYNFRNLGDASINEQAGVRIPAPAPANPLLRTPMAAKANEPVYATVNKAPKKVAAPIAAVAARKAADRTDAPPPLLPPKLWETKKADVNSAKDIQGIGSEEFKKRRLVFEQFGNDAAGVGKR